VFLLIWFSRRRIRDEVAAWSTRPRADALTMPQ
jgi:hypothetical protein